MMVATAAINPSLADPFCCCFQARPRPRPRPIIPLLYFSNSRFQKSESIPQLRTAASLSPWSWSGLKHLPITPPRSNYLLLHRHHHGGKKGKFRGKVIHASLFGVGAPEALVIGVVALLVFGPKGLAEVARNLGKTLRAFQPTIRELQDVSREFKSTLEREIGLDEVSSSINNTYKTTSVSNESQQTMVDPNGTPKSGAYTSEDLLKITQEQLAAASATGPQDQQVSTTSDAVADNPSKIAASTTSSEAGAQIQSSEKVDKES